MKYRLSIQQEKPGLLLRKAREDPALFCMNGRIGFQILTGIGFRQTVHPSIFPLLNHYLL